MLCPFCRSRLVKGAMKAFETLEDHVLDPNSEAPLPMRQTYVCTNCALSNKLLAFWDDAGAFYSGALHQYGFIPKENVALVSLGDKLNHQLKWERMATKIAKFFGFDLSYYAKRKISFAITSLYYPKLNPPSQRPSE